MKKTDTVSDIRKNRSICLPFLQEIYELIINDPMEFRKYINSHLEIFPELFPPDIVNGYRMKDMYRSKKLNINIRRIETEGVAYTIRPSFLMPYMTGFTDEVDNALFLRKFSVPFWALSQVFGKYPMYWYRIEQAIGRNSIVGTTVKKPDNIPKNLTADEKHTKLLGSKVYIATTVGNDCILGAAVAKSASEKDLTDAYQILKNEAQHLNPNYNPDTVNIDGWKGTQNSWNHLFPCVAIIFCFLHVFIKIRDRAKKKYKDIFGLASSKLWDCYSSENKRSFSQRIRRLLEWCKKEKVPEVIQSPIEKLRKNIKAYHVAYDHPDAHRTSNMIDRLMQRMDRYLFSTQYFHGSLPAANLGIRGWAIIQNFAPSNPMTTKKYGGLKSPAERLNKFSYHENWLHNMMISASLGGFKQPPINPL